MLFALKNFTWKSRGRSIYIIPLKSLFLRVDVI